MIPTTKQLKKALEVEDKAIFLFIDGERKHIDRVDEYDDEVLIIPNGDVFIGASKGESE